MEDLKLIFHVDLLMVAVLIATVLAFTFIFLLDRLDSERKEKARIEELAQLRKEWFEKFEQLEKLTNDTSNLAYVLRKEIKSIEQRMDMLYPKNIL